MGGLLEPTGHPSIPLAASRAAGRRRHERRPFDAEVAFTSPTRARGLALNLSHSGIRVMVDREIQPGGRYVLEVRQGSLKVVYYNARAVWSRPFPGGCVVGLELSWRGGSSAATALSRRARRSRSRPATGAGHLSSGRTISMTAETAKVRTPETSATQLIGRSFDTR